MNLKCYHILLLTFFILLNLKAQERPNIILVMADDLGWNDVGFNGSETVKTPWLDSLAASGIIFSRFYAASAVCSPTRASVLTGRNPLRMEIPYANSGHLKQEEITIPEILKLKGYHTGHFGKWHLGTFSKNKPDANRGGKEKFLADYSIPTEHGYDEFFSTESKTPTFDPMIKPAQFEEGESLRFGWKASSENELKEEYGTFYWKGEGKMETDNLDGDDSRVIMDRVIPFIQHAVNNKKPFFTTIWLHTPHLPVVADSTHMHDFQDLSLEEQLYYGSIAAMDEQIGRLWSELGNLRQQEETIIFFCSDNGPERDTPGSARPFRERKRSLYEGGVRVPAFGLWKGKWASGINTAFPAVTSDYLPTVIDLLGIDFPSNRPIDGVSLLPVISNSEWSRTEPIGFICRPRVSWVNHTFKLICDEGIQNCELYNLESDPMEALDRSNEKPEITKLLISELEDWLTSVYESAKGLDY